MRDHTVTVDETTSPASLVFSPVFNVSVPFIDRHPAEGRGARVAVRTEEGREVTYGDLARSVNRCGNALLALGIAPGERMIMVVKDCPEFFYLFWGAIKAGIVPVPVNTLLRSGDFAYAIDNSECAAVFYSPELRSEVEPALAAAAHRPGHACLVEGGREALSGLMASASDRLDPAPARAEDGCFWLYSSGSTGKPKAAVHSHRDMVVTSRYYGQETLGVLEDDVCFSAAKLFFAYGLGNAMTFPLWSGASAVLYGGRPTPEAVFALIERFRPTLYFAVPTLFAAQLRCLEKQSFDTSSVRLCVSAGEALPPEILRRWKERTGITILDGIGSTEALHIFISNREHEVRPGASGRPVPGYDAKIVDEQGAPVQPGEQGRLMIRGLSSAKYYWGAPDKTAATMVGGWLDTGDVYVRDEDGFFFYRGRNDDMLKVGGIWCSPFEIEAMLLSHPAVLEAAVVGRPDRDDLIKPEAFIVLKEKVENLAALERDLLAHCRSGLAPYKYPRWFVFVSDLPKTATGKIQRFKLRNWSRRA